MIFGLQEEVTYIRENSILIEQGHIETIAEALGSRPGLRQFLQGLMGVVSSYIFGFRAFVMFNLHWA